MRILEIVKVIIIGVVEGITEWLPISSTGHMILLDEFISLDLSEEFLSMFLVVIQLGAIFAVPVIFWDRLWPFSKRKNREEKRQTLDLWLRVFVGSAPAALLGFLLDDLLDRYFYSYSPINGLGHFIHTYECDGNPIPSFYGEPERVKLPNTAEELANVVWNNLNSDNKVSLFVRVVNLESGKADEIIINKNK